MRKFTCLILLLFVISFSLFGIKEYKNYTLSEALFTEILGAAHDTFEYIIPHVDTTIDTTAYGIDTNLTYSDIWPSQFEPQSQEAIIQPIDSNDTYSTYDRWAMENWAFALLLTDAGGAAGDSIGAEVQYGFDGTNWTVPYILTSATGTVGTLLTYYPLDTYDNWKLYRYARLRVFNLSIDSVTVDAYIVGRIKDLIKGE